MLFCINLIPKRMRTILLVEDEPINMKLMTRILEKHDMNVVAAHNGNDALKAYSERDDIDVILMDVQMPIMDGFETTRLIRETDKYQEKKTKIIALTAFAYETDREKCLQAGMDDFISKPIDMKLLINKISN